MTYIILSWVSAIFLLIGIRLIIDPPTVAFFIVGVGAGMLATLIGLILQKVDDIYWNTRIPRVPNSWGRIYDTEKIDPWPGDHYEGTSLRDFEED